MREYNWGYPTEVTIVSGKGDSQSEIAAFDAALVNGGIGDVSLIKLTSILPADVVISKKPLSFPPGSNIPAIYTSYVSSDFPEKIAASIVIQPTEGGPNLVAEFSGKAITAIQAKKKAMDTAKMMAQSRGLDIVQSPVSRSIEHQVRKNYYSAVFIGVVYQELNLY